MPVVLSTMQIWVSEKESVGALILHKEGHYHHKIRKTFSYGGLTDVQHINCLVVEERGAARDARKQISFKLLETGFEMVCEVFNYKWPVLMLSIQICGDNPLMTNLSRRLDVVENKLLSIQLNIEQSSRDAHVESCLAERVQMLETLVNQQQFQQSIAQGEGLLDGILHKAIN